MSGLKLCYSHTAFRATDTDAYSVFPDPQQTILATVETGIPTYGLAEYRLITRYVHSVGKIDRLARVHHLTPGGGDSTEQHG